MDSFNSRTTKPLYRGTQIVWFLVGLIEVFLGFRFILKLLGANTAAAFTRLIYAVTKPLMIPFLRVFGISQIEGSVFEWTTLLAMVVYICIGWGIIKLFLMSKTVSTPEAAEKLV